MTGVVDRSAAPLPDGLVAFVKKDCPTCVLVAPVLAELARTVGVAGVITQDDKAFPGEVAEEGVEVTFDESLDTSWHWEIETVPTLLRIRDGKEVARTVGWSREQWVAFCESPAIGEGLPDHRPGCGALNLDPVRHDELIARHSGLASRRVEFAQLEDTFEAMYDRGWSDGLPIVPPTEARVARMLEGTTRSPDEIVAIVPPDLVECTVEKVAVNAAMAGCKPEYLPVVLTALEAVCSHEFNMHGLLATTFFSGPIIIVNGPIRDRIGMNHGGNVLGQGNRANSTIGRAVQLTVRNVGGGKPGGVDQATMGSPGKLGFSFAEDEAGSPFTPLSVSRGFEEGVDTVTVFAGHGPTSIIDQKSRDPESLTRSFAACLRTNAHPKLPLKIDAALVVSPEHGRIYREAGWGRDELLGRLNELLLLNTDELVTGFDGITEGVPAEFAGMQLPKFRDGGLLICHAGGDAGLFSAILGGWVNGDEGSDPVTKEITP